MRYAAILLLLATAIIGQTRGNDAKTAQITLYYPGAAPETFTITEGGKAKDDWYINEGCLIYRKDGNLVNFCGTFKVVRKAN